MGSAIIKSPISFLTAHHFMYGEIDNRQIKALDVRKFVGCALRLSERIASAIEIPPAFESVGRRSSERTNQRSL